MFDDLMGKAGSFFQDLTSAAGSAWGPHLPFGLGGPASDPRSLMGEDLTGGAGGGLAMASGLCDEAPYAEAVGAIPQVNSDAAFDAQLRYLQTIDQAADPQGYEEALAGLEAMGENDAVAHGME
jgi:hypothetical protein